MENHDNLVKLITAALMAAITFVVTAALKIPIGSNGYIHPGDAFVLLSGIILGPIYGGLAGGIGSALADLLSPYVVYTIPTLSIKFLAAMAAAISYRHIRKNSVIIAGIFVGILVTLGYFISDRYLLGSFGAALIGVPANLLQNVMGIFIAALLLPILKRIPQIKAMINPAKHTLKQ